jgi:hypothetical protein
VDELKELTAYAKERGISIMPEINVPGHAGAWAGGARDENLVVNCPKFICEKGYGLALNVSHPELPFILKDILAETIEIFEYVLYIILLYRADCWSGDDSTTLTKPFVVFSCLSKISKQPTLSSSRWR